MLSFRVLVAFCKTKVNDVDVILVSFCPANKEVIRFDITVDNSLLVNFLDSLNELDRNMEDAFEVELSSTLLK